MATNKKVLTIRLAVDLNSKLKDKAEKESTTVTALITRYIEEGLKNSENTKVLKKFDDLEQKLSGLQNEITVTINHARDDVKQDIRKVEGKAELAARLVAGQTEKKEDNESTLTSSSPS